MKRLLLLFLVVVACHGSAARPGESITGAPAPRIAVEQFLGAVRAQDLQAMSNVWGTKDGPAREQIERTELEKREIIMQCFFDHEKFRILDETPAEGGQRAFRVELSKGPTKITRTFYTVRGPSERWYVVNAEMSSKDSMCRRPA